VVPTVIKRDAGTSVRLLIAGRTVIEAIVCTFPEGQVAVIVAVPAETPVTRADRLFVREGRKWAIEFGTGPTEAIAVFELDQVTVLLVALDGLGAAVKVTV
jgi:hypothetical protein